MQPEDQPQKYPLAAACALLQLLCMLVSKLTELQTKFVQRNAVVANLIETRDSMQAVGSVSDSARRVRIQHIIAHALEEQSGTQETMQREITPVLGEQAQR